MRGCGEMDGYIIVYYSFFYTFVHRIVNPFIINRSRVVSLSSITKMWHFSLSSERVYVYQHVSMRVDKIHFAFHHSALSRYALCLRVSYF